MASGLRNLLHSVSSHIRVVVTEHPVPGSIPHLQTTGNIEPSGISAPLVHEYARDKDKNLPGCVAEHDHERIPTRGAPHLD